MRPSQQIQPTRRALAVAAIIGAALFLRHYTAPTDHHIRPSAHVSQLTLPPDAPQNNYVAPIEPVRTPTEPRIPIKAPVSLAQAFPDISTVPHWGEYLRAADKLTIAPEDGLPLTFEKKHLKDEGSYVTWFGANASGATVVCVATPGGGQTTLLSLPDRPGWSQYTIHTASSGETTVVTSNSSAETCAVQAGVAQHANIEPPRPALATPIKVEMHPAAMEFIPNATNTAVYGAPAKADASTLYVGVLFLYQQATLDMLVAAKQIDPVNYIDGLAKATTEACNVVLNNSAVTNFQFKYVGNAQAADYTRTPNCDIDFDLAAISGTGLIGSWVANKAADTGAGLVVMINSGPEPGVRFSGMANSNMQAPISTLDQARAVVEWDTAIAPPSALVILHEMGHVFGCEHDRMTAQVTSGDGYYCYGMIWRTDPVVTTYLVPAGSTREDYSNGNVTFTLPDGTHVYTYSHESDDASATISSPDKSGVITVVNTIYNTAGTIMSYAGRIPYFSNPNLTLDITGQLMEYPGPSNWGVQALGKPIADPQAAYNAKVMSDSAPTMSGYGSGSFSVPQITAAVQDANVIAGNQIALSVTATGGGLKYQWAKDGTDISGANSSFFIRNSAVLADAGTYTVSIKNPVGTATGSAKVTVSQPAPGGSSSGSSSSGSGGGGGGAVSDGFVGALAALGFIRWISRRKL